MKIKRIALMVLASAMLVGTIGCSSGGSSDDSKKLEGTPPVQDIQSAPGDTRPGDEKRDGG